MVSFSAKHFSALGISGDIELVLVQREVWPGASHIMDKETARVLVFGAEYKLWVIDVGRRGLCRVPSRWKIVIEVSEEWFLMIGGRSHSRWARRTLHQMHSRSNRNPPRRLDGSSNRDMHRNRYQSDPTTT
jgi:hypothetical protein